MDTPLARRKNLLLGRIRWGCQFSPRKQKLTCLASASSLIVLMASRAPSRKLNRLGRGCSCCCGGAEPDCTEDAADADDLSPRLVARMVRGASDSSAYACRVVCVSGNTRGVYAHAKTLGIWIRVRRKHM